MTADTCELTHDWFTALLSTGLIVGLVISYLPQHLRIVQKGSSQGLSPWSLLLGSTACLAGFLNIITLQWGIIKCCRVVSALSCIEATAGIFQVGVMWFLFTMILVLYMIYFPPELKYVSDVSGNEEVQNYGSTVGEPKVLEKRPEWRMAIIVSWLTFAHLAISTLVTFYLLETSRDGSERLLEWATFLGSSSAILAAVQYLPQMTRTYRAKTVGALSIPMMAIQTPGAIFMILSIALRPGTNWTSWITYAVSGVMQGTLLTMCVFWKFRQNRLHIDDFGRPLGLPEDLPNAGSDETTETLIETAIGDAVEDDVRAGATIVVEVDGEQTPLIGRPVDANKENQSWLAWVRKRRT